MKLNVVLRCCLISFVLAFASISLVYQGIILASIATTKKMTWDGESWLMHLDSPGGVPSTAREKRVYTVFSTGCSPSQDWQSQTLVYNHRMRGIDGDLVRLMACSDPNYVLPHHSYHKYRVVRTPDFDVNFPGDPYSPRNRPGSLEYWLNGRSNDTDLPMDDDVLIMVDPDMVLLSSHIDVGNITRGFGIGTKYGLGMGCLNHDFVQQTCNGKCEVLEAGYNPSFGHPMVLTAGDTRIHAAVWMNVTEQMRKIEKKWETEMFSNVVAHRLLGTHITVLSTMLSCVDVCDDSEPWDIAKWNAEPSSLGVWVAHYCQHYKLESFAWSKKDNIDIDIRLCDSSMNFPSPQKEALAEMEQWRNSPLNSFTAGKENVKQSRSVWMLDNTWDYARRAISAYYEEFCLV